jgi:ribonuclease P protein component
MLPKKNRLSLRRNLQAQSLNERIVQGKYFGLRIIRRDPSADPRFAIIVSSKVAKKATQRNSIKRLFCEAIRPLLKDLKMGYDVVLLTNRKATEASLSELQDSVMQSFKKANLLESINETSAR